MNEARARVDVAKLRALYAGSAVAQAALDYFAGRQRNRRWMMLDNLLTTLLSRGQACNRAALNDFFRQLAEIGCGQFVQGQRARFEWAVGLVSVGRLATAETEVVEAVESGDYTDDGVEDAEQSELVSRPFPLRPTL